MRKFYAFKFLVLVFVLGLGMKGWGQVSITTNSSIIENFTGYQGTSTPPTNWLFSGNTTFIGSNQTTGSSGGWYGNNNISFLGSGSQSNGNCTWVLHNNTGSTINGFTFSFLARMWKSGTNSPVVTVTWATSTTNTNPNSGNLPNAITSFSDATANITTGATITQNISSASISPGNYIFIRFLHPGGSNSDNLGWDDVTFTPSIASSTAPNLSIAGTASHGSACPNSSTSTLTYTITNSGTVQASGVTVSSSDPQFVVSNLSSTTISPNGGTATYQVTFTPASAGSKSATVTVSSTTSGSNSPTSSLTGTGTTPVAQAVTTSASTNVTTTAARLNGSFTTAGVCPATTEKGFVLALTSANSDPQVNGSGVTKTPVSGTSTGTYFLDLTGLPNSTGYSYKAYVYNGSTYTYGTTETFTTATPAPSLSITGTTNHGSVCPGIAAAPITYTITNNGTATAEGVNVVSNNSDFVVSNISATSIPVSGTATYQVTFTPASAGSKSATVTVSSTTSGSNSPTSSLTGTGTTPVAQAVTTSAANNITTTAARLNGSFTTAGVCPATTEKGFVYALTSANSDPQVNGSGVTKTPVSGTSTGTYFLDLTSLPNGTSYSYKAYVYNGSTYTYGSVSTFTTLTPITNDDCSGAITLALDAAPITGNVTGATQSIAAIACNGNTGSANDDVWYKFTTTNAGTYTITVVGAASFDAVVGLRSGACNGTSISCADVTLNGGTEILASSLLANTTYLVRVYDYDGDVPSTPTFTIAVAAPPLDAPVAQAATNLTGNSFTANWGAVMGAEGYQLDVSTSAAFTTTIAGETFENNLTNFTSTGGNYFTGTSSATTDAPSSSPFASQGTFGYGVTNGTATITSVDLNTLNQSNISLSFKLASFSIGSTSNGADQTDMVTLSVSPDGGTTYYSTLRVIGNSNARWAFDATGTAHTAYDGNASPIDFAAQSGTTINGYSTIVVNNLPATSNLRIKIELLNNSSNERWIIDNLSITGSAGSSVPGFDSLAVSNVTSYPVTGLAPNTSYYYRVRAKSTNSTSPNSNVQLVTTFKDPTTSDYVSNGAVSTSSASNWLYNNTGSNYVAATIAPASSNNITVANGHNLTVNNNFTVGTGKTLLLATGSTANIQATASLTVAGTANFNGQGVTLISNASGTARIGQVSGTISGANNVTVERYIPLSKRAYRLLTAPVIGTNINAAWQSGMTWDGSSHHLTGTNTLVTPQAGYGTLITGHGMGTALNANQQGFDFWSNIANSTSSIRRYDINDVSRWVPLVGGTTANNFDLHQAYLLYLRGDRSVSTGTTVSATTLQATGSITAGIVNTPTFTDEFKLIGNPYPSPINFDKVYSNSGSSIKRLFWVWDPLLNTTGGYKLITYVTANNSYQAYPSPFDGSAGESAGGLQFIQSGQGFFVQPPDGQVGRLQFTEENKVSTNHNLLFREGNGSAEQLKINLLTQGSTNTLLDGVGAIYDNSYSVDLSDANDVLKANNSSENIAIYRNQHDLAVEARPLISSADTIFLRLYNTAVRNYELQLQAENMVNSNLTAFLEDSYTGATTVIDLFGITNRVPFSITTDNQSTGADRFRIVFRDNTTLPVTISNIKAYQKTQVVQVDWTVQADEGIAIYEVQKSIDGIEFSKIGTVKAQNKATEVLYHWIDPIPSEGVNYYRVKAIGNNGEVKFTIVVNVRIGKSASQVVVYPNPIKGTQINLLLNSLQYGIYTINILNGEGKSVHNASLKHWGGSLNTSLHLEHALPAGLYQLQIQCNDFKIVKPLLIQQ